jgi:hypothetical protein
MHKIILNYINYLIRYLMKEIYGLELVITHSLLVDLISVLEMNL